MNSITTADNTIKQGMPVITHSGVPVVTTELLAQLYGTDRVRIRQNHKRNYDRFVEGKHFFNLKGVELKEFKNRVSQRYSVTLGNLVDKRTPKLTLWTERGAARHAKMLETDQAWDVFEKLEDFYFNQKEESAKLPKPRKSTAAQLTPLRQTVERLITSGMGNIYRDIWKLVHERFEIETIQQLSPPQITEAVEYLNALEGEYLGKAEVPAPKAGVHINDHQLNDIYLLIKRLKWAYDIFTEYNLKEHLSGLGSPAGVRIHEHLALGVIASRRLSDLTTEFDAAHYRLGLNQYAKF